MDQLSCATGGVIAIDFKDPAAPTLRQVQADLDALGYALCVIDSRASHADLTADYARHHPGDVPGAACFGREVLGDVDPTSSRRSLSTVRATCGDRAALRAIHFFQDDRRVELERRALEAGDMDAFLHTSASPAGPPSCTCRTCPTTGRAAPSPSPCCWRWRRTCWRARGPAGSHGGGFAGTIQAFVPTDALESFVAGMETVTGQGACHVLNFRPVGTTVLVP